MKLLENNFLNFGDLSFFYCKQMRCEAHQNFLPASRKFQVGIISISYLREGATVRIQTYQVVLLLIQHYL